MKFNYLIVSVTLNIGININVHAGEYGVFSENQICKAGIAKIMGRNPAIIKIDRVDNDAIYLSYVRQDDQTKWKYKCKVEGNRIIWGSDTGRWRTHPMDSKVSFRVADSSVMVVDAYGDGSSSEETYSLEQLGK